MNLPVFAAIAVSFAMMTPLAFRIVAGRPGDAVEVKTEGARTVFVIRSASGIGRAVVEKVGASWPTSVVVKLKLGGLESLRLTAGRDTIELAVSSREGRLQIRQWKDGRENDPLDAKSPFWSQVHILTKDGQAATELPLHGGSFEIVLPRRLFEQEPPSMELRWIDFHR